MKIKNYKQRERMLNVIWLQFWNNRATGTCHISVISNINFLSIKVSNQAAANFVILFISAQLVHSNWILNVYLLICFWRWSFFIVSSKQEIQVGDNPIGVFLVAVFMSSFWLFFNFKFYFIIVFNNDDITYDDKY